VKSPRDVGCRWPAPGGTRGRQPDEVDWGARNEPATDALPRRNGAGLASVSRRMGRQSGQSAADWELKPDAGFALEDPPQLAAMVAAGMNCLAHSASAGDSGGSGGVR